MQRKKLIIVSIIVIIIIVFGVIILIHKTKLFENAKYTVNNFIAGERVNKETPNMTVDITNIVNDKYPEHEHVWYNEYDDINHWSKCIICKEETEHIEHISTTIWKYGRESCEVGNTYTIVCECGYGKNGVIPCTWKGEWGQYANASNLHTRRCAVCRGNINDKTYIDEVNGGVLVPDTSSDGRDFGMNSRAMRCVLADGSNRPCGSSLPCAECGGPLIKSAQHNWAATATDKIIRCHRCGLERRNL